MDFNFIKSVCIEIRIINVRMRIQCINCMHIMLVYSRHAKEKPRRRGPVS